MGSPLESTIANFFLGHIKEKNFSDKSICLPKLHLRYADDVFAIFDNNNNCNEFLKVLNRQHNNIKFTVGKTTNSLHFLDLELEIINHGFNSWVWRKPTNTGLLLHHTAKCPKEWKTGLNYVFFE